MKKRIYLAKFLNFFLSPFGKYIYFTIRLNADSKQAKQRFADNVLRFKNEGKPYGSLYEAYKSEYERLEREELTVVEGWERVLRVTWDEINIEKTVD